MRVVNEGDPPRGEKVPIDNQENVNGEVPPQGPQGPQDPNIEGNMYNVWLRVTF